MSEWTNEPPYWERRGEQLIVRTGKDTDFWNRTFYDFVHANGHFLGEAASGDFSAVVSFSAAYDALYDQAGVMLRVDDRNWLKAGIEYTDGEMHFSVVVTRDDQSDWSMTPLPAAAGAGLELRLTRHAEALRVQFRLPAEAWRMARLAFLAMPETVAVGPMCCSPTRQGLEVTFSHFEIGPPIERQLHDE